MIIPLEEQLNTILAPIFGNEIYPIVHPDPDGLISSVSDTYAVFTVVGGKSFNKLEGDTEISRPRTQISIYTIDYTEMKAKTRAIAAAMKAANALATQAVDNSVNQFEIAGALSSVSITVPTEGREPDTKRFYSHSEFYCWACS